MLETILRFLRSDAASDRVVPPTGFTALLTSVSTGAMAFLAVFAIALSLAAGDLAARWEAELTGTATVRISAPTEQVEAQTEAVLTALSQTPGIAGTRQINEAEQQALLAPWFGVDLPLDRLRLPVLIEVQETAEGPDIEGLAQRLAAEAPGAVYDNHNRWRLPLIEAAANLRFLGLISLLLIAGVTAVTVALAAFAALSANGKIIDVLRLVGARDNWISRAFVRRYTLRALGGAAVGAALGMIVVALLPGGVETGVLSGLGFNGAEWLWPLLVPVIGGAIAWGATRTAAVRRLKESA
ncbi:MAG: cell division protein FtsX [Silicimonas sp.]|nr:cell division protein FtsX [Silicimonas sp.]